MTNSPGQLLDGIIYALKKDLTFVGGMKEFSSVQCKDYIWTQIPHLGTHVSQVLHTQTFLHAIFVLWKVTGRNKIWLLETLKALSLSLSLSPSLPLVLFFAIAKKEKLLKSFQRAHTQGRTIQQVARIRSDKNETPHPRRTWPCLCCVYGSCFLVSNLPF